MEIIIAEIVTNGLSKELHRYGENAIRIPRLGEVIDMSPKDDSVIGFVENIIHYPNRNPQETWVFIRTRSEAIGAQGFPTSTRFKLPDYVRNKQ